jgi:SAM-dependent methyltransferase
VILRGNSKLKLKNNHMKVIKSVAQKIPGIPRLYAELQNLKQKRKLKGKTAEDIFAEIHQFNEWGSNESVSGAGSALEQTQVIINKLPELFDDFGIKSMLDIPCGDFNWMKNVDLKGVNYIGADIVEEIIKENKSNSHRGNISFQKLNLAADELPKVDLIFCRDCLVHFSFGDIRNALQNICRSDSSYLLTTTFTARPGNHDIMTGQWRPINLELEPFSLPKPTLIIDEKCTEGDGRYADKSLGLWRIAEIKKIID